MYVDSEEALWKRLKNRDPQKYTYECVPVLYETNVELQNSIQRIPEKLCRLYSINVSNLSVENTVLRIDTILNSLFG